jgi:hypothetical protein
MVRQAAMNFLRMWFLLTAGILAAALMWSFAPILIPVFMLVGVLGLLVLGIIAAARWLEARRRPPGLPFDPPGSDTQSGS